jgi:tetratricopeptide (TPR) repeat protein
MITDAAASQTPITVNELLTRSEELALNDASGSPENRAAVLEMIADRYVATDNAERAEPLLARALQLLDTSRDAALRSRLMCKHSAASAELGHAEPALQAMYAEIERLDADPQTASECLFNTTSIHLAEQRPAQALRDAQLGLEKSRAAGNNGAIEAALLGAAGYAYHLDARDVEAERYFDQALRKYRELGREHSDGALTVLNDWGVSMLAAGVPRRALELLEESMRVERERGPDIELTATVVGNHGLALQALGRLDQARAAFDLECRLAIGHSDEFSEMHCLVGESSLSIQTAQLDGAQEYLNRLAGLIEKSSLPADSPPARVRSLLQGRLDLARGKLAEARAGFDRALVHEGKDPTSMHAYVGRSMAALAGNDPDGAVEAARRALRIARALQGDVPHSSQTGLASLWLGRSLLRAGDRVEGRNALVAAITHLSNTIDLDHPYLLQARAELTDALHGATASNGQERQ